MRLFSLVAGIAIATAATGLAFHLWPNDAACQIVKTNRVVAGYVHDISISLNLTTTQNVDWNNRLELARCPAPTTKAL